MKYILEERFILKEAGNLLEADDDLFASGAKTDWATLLKKAQASGDQKEVSNIWNSYFTEEWGNDAQHARDLGEAFIIELENLGFSANINPFINYVRDLFANKIYPNSDRYGTLHNAYNRNKITDATLKGEDVLQKNNLIFSAHFFEKDSASMLDYIDLWNTCDNLVRTQKLVENDVLRTRYANGEDSVEKIDDFFKDVFFKPGNAIAKVDTKGKVTEDLNEISRIQEVLKLCFNTDIALDKSEELDATIETILTDFVAGDKAKAKAAINYIAKQSYKTAVDITNAIKRATNNDLVVDNTQEIAFVGWLKAKHLKLPTKNIENMLIEIGKNGRLIS